MPTFAQGVPRVENWVPNLDPARSRAADRPSPLESQRWTAFGFSAVGHVIAINPATGGLVLSATDFAMPYYALPFQITRTLDVQESHAQASFLKHHPNVDPRPHLFGDWIFQQEAQLEATWLQHLAETLVADSGSGSAMFYREYPNFGVNEIDGGEVANLLAAYGIPRVTLDALRWSFQPYDALLRTIRGRLEVLTGQFVRENLVDSAQVEICRFDPVAGRAARYSSQYAYQQLIDLDGKRETTVQALITTLVDALGHSIQFAPVDSAAPYRRYRLSDGTGRAFRLDCGDRIEFLDGNMPGAYAKSYMISTVTDETRAASNVATYTYDAGRLVTMTLPGQDGRPDRVIRYDHDADGHLVRITDAGGKQLSFDYVEDLLDADDRLEPRFKLQRIADGDGNAMEFEYDHPNRATTVRFVANGQLQRSTVYRYIEDAFDTRERCLVSDETTVTRGFSGAQQVKSTRTYSSDGRFNVVQIADALGNTFQLDYNIFNQTTGVVDPVGHRRDFTYDVQQAPTALLPNRYDLVQISETNFDRNGNSFPVTRAFTYRRYDAASSAAAADTAQSTHRLATMTNELGNLWQYDYDDAGSARPLFPTTVEDPTGAKLARVFDARGAATAETDQVGSTTKWLFDAQGRLVQEIDPNNAKRSWVYDPGTGWLTWASDALAASPGDPLHSMHYVWDDGGRLIESSDPVGDKTKYAYTSCGRLASVTKFAPASRAWQFAYDASGALVLLTDPRSHSTSFLYDEAGRLFQTYRDTATGRSLKITFDLAGRVKAIQDRNGQTTTFDYDPLSRVTNLQEPPWPFAAPTNAGKTVNFSYDALGNRLTVVDSDLGTTAYDYDAASHQLQRTDPDGIALGYAYDVRGMLARLNTSDGAVDLRFSRDAAGRVVVVRDGKHWGPSRIYGYAWQRGTLRDNLYEITFANRGRVSFDYDANRRLTSVKNEWKNAAVSSYSYGYRRDDLLGSVSGSHQATYDYDGLKQLVRESDVGRTDGYDEAGNRLWRAATPPPASQQCVYDGDNRLISDPAAGIQYSYDNNGNLIAVAKNPPVALTYDGANRLRRITEGVRSIELLYDVDGRLVRRRQKIANTNTEERFRYANQSVLTVGDGFGELQQIVSRDDQGRLLRIRTRSQLQNGPAADAHSTYALHDRLMSITRLIDWNGVHRLVEEYDGWGNPTKAAGAIFGYRGAYREPGFGMVRFGARWYLPRLGRWLTQDPIMSMFAREAGDLLPVFDQVAHLYRYANNSPLSYSDPSGLIPKLPKSWPKPPNYKGGYGWKTDPGNGELIDPDGNRWHWHPEDEGHNDHWDKKFKNGKKVRVDKNGKDLGEDAFKDQEGSQETSEDENKKTDNNAKYVAEGIAAVGVGYGIYTVGKWAAAIFFAPETGGLSLGAALFSP